MKLTYEEPCWTRISSTWAYRMRFFNSTLLVHVVERGVFEDIFHVLISLGESYIHGAKVICTYDLVYSINMVLEW